MNARLSWTILGSLSAAIHTPIGHGHMFWVNLFALNMASVVREQDAGDLNTTRLVRGSVNWLLVMNNELSSWTKTPASRAIGYSAFSCNSSRLGEAPKMSLTKSSKTTNAEW